MNAAVKLSKLFKGITKGDLNTYRGFVLINAIDKTAVMTNAIWIVELDLNYLNIKIESLEHSLLIPVEILKLIDKQKNTVVLNNDTIILDGGISVKLSIAHVSSEGKFSNDKFVYPNYKAVMPAPYTPEKSQPVHSIGLNFRNLSILGDFLSDVSGFSAAEICFNGDKKVIELLPLSNEKNHYIRALIMPCDKPKNR